MALGLEAFGRLFVCLSLAPEIVAYYPNSVRKFLLAAFNEEKRVDREREKCHSLFKSTNHPPRVELSFYSFLDRAAIPQGITLSLVLSGRRVQDGPKINFYCLVEIATKF